MIATASEQDLSTDGLYGEYMACHRSSEHLFLKSLCMAGEWNICTAGMVPIFSPPQEKRACFSRKQGGGEADKRRKVPRSH